MKIYKYPNSEDWDALCKRPAINSNDLNNLVQEILENVNNNGDEALFDYAKKFDNVDLEQLAVSSIEIENAKNSVPQKLKAAINIAKNNIQIFHQSQKEPALKIETMTGVECWRQSVPIERVGLYIPGGSAPLFSTILMLGIPAVLAGCKNIFLCTPPDKEGNVNPAILYTANLVGIQSIYKVGGAQAIAAMTFGTETIPKADKIFGPGNQYVTKAKELAQTKGTAIDMPAGPSEVLVIADQTGNPAFIASDLLSQAEHGADSQVVLLSDDEKILEESITQLNIQVEKLPRKDIAKAAIKNSRAILLKDIDTCVQFSNNYAPEHLIIASDNADNFIDKIQNAGSVFLGNYSCESAGDYASGTNHTLPTNGFAKCYSGVSLDSFIKKITFQKLNKEGIQNLGSCIETMAEAEGLFAHKNAVTIRLKSLENV